MGDGVEFDIVVAFLVVGGRVGVWSDAMTDGRTGIIEVGGIMATVVIHVVDVIFGFDVWVKLANLGEGLFPSVVRLVDSI